MIRPSIAKSKDRLLATSAHVLVPPTKNKPFMHCFFCKDINQASECVRKTTKIFFVEEEDITQQIVLGHFDPNVLKQISLFFWNKGRYNKVAELAARSSNEESLARAFKQCQNIDNHWSLNSDTETFVYPSRSYEPYQSMMVGDIAQTSDGQIWLVHPLGWSLINES